VGKVNHDSRSWLTAGEPGGINPSTLGTPQKLAMKINKSNKSPREKWRHAYTEVSASVLLWDKIEKLTISISIQPCQKVSFDLRVTSQKFYCRYP
jgi:hypothetical protein